MPFRPKSLLAFFWTLPATLALVAPGCGSGSQFPETLPVSGKVTYKGHPVPRGTITFQPDQGQVATAPIQPDGSYKLSTFAPEDGALPGHHKVMILANDGAENMMPGSSPGYKPPKDLVPKKFSSLATSGLAADVVKGKSDYNFDLQ